MIIKKSVTMKRIELLLTCVVKSQVSSHFTHFVDFTPYFPLPGNVTDSLDDAEVAVLLKPQLEEACEDGMLFLRVHSVREL